MKNADAILDMENGDFAFVFADGSSLVNAMESRSFALADRKICHDR